MIAKLSGVVSDIFLENMSIILVVNGVGYLIYLPQSILSTLNVNDNCVFYICTNVKEDAIQLFGINTKKEMEIMQLLVQVSGVSYKIACNILSNKTPEEITDTILIGNVNGLKVSGVGNKVAEKIIYALKNKIKKFNHTNKISDMKKIVSNRNDDIFNNAVKALTSLGYKEFKAQNIIREIISEDPNIKLEDLIKKSITILS